MARYTCSLIISIPFENLQPAIIDLLMECGLEVQYYTSDYVMGRQTLGEVPYLKLVTVEVLVDKSTATDEETRMDLVVKNDELPLQIHNHCKQMFEFIKQAMEDCRHWHLIASVAG